MKHLLFMVFVFVGFSTVQAQDKWVAPAEAKSIVNPIGDMAAEAAKGKKVYRSTCLICHGPRGEGNGPGGAALNPKPANFTTKEFQSQTDGEIFWKLSNGRGAMVAFKESIPEDKRWQLVAFIRSFEK